MGLIRRTRENVSGGLAEKRPKRWDQPLTVLKGLPQKVQKKGRELQRVKGAKKTPEKNMAVPSDHVFRNRGCGLESAYKKGNIHW